MEGGERFAGASPGFVNTTSFDAFCRLAHISPPAHAHTRSTSSPCIPPNCTLLVHFLKRTIAFSINSPTVHSPSPQGTRTVTVWKATDTRIRLSRAPTRDTQFAEVPERREQGTAAFTPHQRILPCRPSRTSCYGRYPTECGDMNNIKEQLAPPIQTILQMHKITHTPPLHGEIREFYDVSILVGASVDSLNMKSF